MTRLPLLGGMTLLLVGCGGGDSTGPPTVPDIAGTYQGEVSATASSAVANQNLGTFPGTATISQQKSNVSIVVVPPQGGALTLSGTIAAGGAITLDNEAGLTLLQGALPQCSFAGAPSTNRASLTQGRLILTANIVGASCPWVESNGAFLPTTFVVAF
jgi:hypothetical protein